MPVLIIACLKFRDVERYRKYQSRFAPVLAKFNGAVLVADENMSVLEGDVEADKVVILEFPDRPTAERFHNSPEYQEIATDRRAGADAFVMQVRSFY
jgi:uncharacterized protein (DUF1330 family)